MDDFLAVKAQLGDFVNHFSVNDGSGGQGVCLYDRQVAGQVLVEPGMLPAPGKANVRYVHTTPAYLTRKLAKCELT